MILTAPASVRSISPAAPRPADVFLAGVGAVGSALLRQMAAVRPPALRLVGACTTRGTAWADGAALDPDTAASGLDGDAPDWGAIESDLAARAARGQATVFVDATGAESVARRYERLLAAGVHVATPSKRAQTVEQAYFDRLRGLSAETGARFRYEAAAGAGLPAVQAVADMAATGDHLRSVRGVLSGTLTYLFSEVERGVAFSAAVREAVRRGYAEPDPRDDLSGEDVRRKLLVLARTAGLRLERADVQVEPLYPQAFRDLPLDAFLDRMGVLDEAWAERARAAAADGAVLRYVGEAWVEGGVVLAEVGVQAVPKASALGGLTGTDNLIALTSDRYRYAPMTLRGPGAGPDVTAAAVFADVLKIVAG